MPTIKIIVAGTARSGRSTIAAAIASYLQSINIDHETIIEDKPTSAGDMVNGLKALRENGLKVIVETVQVNRLADVSKAQVVTPTQEHAE